MRLNLFITRGFASLSFAVILFMQIFLSPFVVKSEEYYETQKPFNNSEYINIDGIKLHYRLWLSSSLTEKPWILLVHGFSGSTYTWNKNINSLVNAQFNVVAVDMPPFGYSDKNKKLNQSVDSRATLLLKFTNTINPEIQWHIIGHSMGGGIVAAMAIIEPERIDKVILVAPALFGKIKPGRTITQKIISFSPIEWSLATLGRIFFIRKSKVKKLIESAYGEKGTEDDIMAYYTPLTQKGIARAIVASFTRANPTRTIDISDLNKHCLAIWGANDTWVPYTNMKKYADQIPDISTVIIKDTGHNPMETVPDLFNSIVIKFLTQTD